MMVIGGVAVAIDSKSLGGCLVDEFIRVFNLNTLVFMDEYNPEKQDSYKIPQKITAIIGGE